MKLTINKLAKILAELPDQVGRVPRWESLPYHRKLTYNAEAEKIIRVLRIFKKEEENE